MAEGHVLLDEGQPSMAFERFDYAFDLVQAILDQETLLFLPYLYYIFIARKRYSAAGRIAEDARVYLADDTHQIPSSTPS